MRKKKILFAIESLSGGGAEKVLSTILNHINCDKFEIGLFSLLDSGVNKENIPSHIKYHYALPGKGSNSWLYRIKYKLIYNILPLSIVYRWFVPKGYDVEVAFIEGFITKLFSKSPKSRKIAWVHVDLALFPWTINEGIYASVEDEIKAYSRYSKIITVSKTVCDNFKATYGLENTVIYNPIDSKDILKKSLKESGLPENGRIRIISVGRLVYQKSYDRLLNAFCKLLKDGADAELIILGEGNEREELQHMASSLGISDRVIFGGFKKNPYCFMKASDIFVCSSRFEGFSLVIAEAMVTGLPIVSTNCSGPNELLDDGRFGLLVDNDEQSIYNGLKQLAFDATARKHYSEKSLERAADFDLGRVMESIETLLSSSTDA